MALWDKLRTELDRAGRVAQTAYDEGKARLELAHLRQLSDKAAQALGYAVFNARRDGQELDADSYARLSETLAKHQGEIQRIEAEIESAGGKPPSRGKGDDGAGEAGTSGPAAGVPDPMPTGGARSAESSTPEQGA